MKNLQTFDRINNLVRAYDEAGIFYCLNAVEGVLNAEGEGWNLEIVYCDSFIELECDYWNITGEWELKQQLPYFAGLRVQYKTVCEHDRGKTVFIRYQVAE